jgi:PAS domain S-box-containing protein
LKVTLSVETAWNRCYTPAMGSRKRPHRGGIVGVETHGTDHANLVTIHGQREEFFRTILDSLAEGVIITDRQSRILYASALMKAISGYAPDELLGRISYEILSPRSNWGHMRRRLQERLSGLEEDYEHELIKKDGSLSWVAVKATPYRNASGEISGTVGALSCIDHQKSLERENEYLRSEVRTAKGLDQLVGTSAALARVRNQIDMVARTEASVLICGETGTGKERVAVAVHDLSNRKAKPLVRVNCAAIPKELFESEFFGHVKGAFTGAINDRVGRFELANGGTLFLDEVGEIPLELQGKLLRVIQEGQFERIGENRTRTVDVRLIAATNRDLEQEGFAGRFRSDLYYRLSVFPIDVPPLRERREDILPLAELFLLQSSKRLGMKPPVLAPTQRRELERYDWPGNARELQNVIERSVILAAHGPFLLNLDHRVRRPSGADAKEDASAQHPIHLLRELKESEKDLVIAALKKARGKIYGGNGAAALLGMKPTTLSSKLARLGLRREDFGNG